MFKRTLRLIFIQSWISLKKWINKKLSAFFHSFNFHWNSGKIITNSSQGYSHNPLQNPYSISPKKHITQFVFRFYGDVYIACLLTNLARWTAFLSNLSRDWKRLGRPVPYKYGMVFVCHELAWERAIEFRKFFQSYFREVLRCVYVYNKVRIFTGKAGKTRVNISVIL